jgi:hypothetical protein
MYNIKKLSNNLKISQYFFLLKSNNLFFICLSCKDPKLDNLKSSGFKFKSIDNNKLKRFHFFKNIRSGLNGHLLFVYKKEFDPEDIKAVNYIIKTFSVLIFLYEGKFYPLSKLKLLINQTSNLSKKGVLLGLLSKMHISFFYKLHLQVNSFCEKKISI